MASPDPWRDATKLAASGPALRLVEREAGQAGRSFCSVYWRSTVIGAPSAD